MYLINPESNRISRLETKKFSELGFTERKHLQEWLANEPEALGEELLIIQKEFDGFSETRERLDLLALDKDGNLVIIENKLDDTGRDVVWQGLKYASYCSNLSKAQILDIFQQYLVSINSGEDGISMICEFLETPDFDEVVLNQGSRQRLIFVAAKFRKEVTSTALWLINYGVDVRCFKVTPYALNDALFLNVEQIIPTPEARQLMIGMNAKEAEEKYTEAELKNRHKIRLEYWERALESFKKSKFELFSNISPSKDHWISAGSGVRSCPFSLIFGAKVIRVEFNMQRPITEENKFIFGELLKSKEKIQKAFGSDLELEWLKLDSKKASRIQHKMSVDGYNKDNWPSMIEWMNDKMVGLEKAIKPFLPNINNKLRDEIYQDAGE